MPVEPTSGNPPLTREYLARTPQGHNELGQDDFLQLIIAQMRNQNPLEPMKDTDFIAQMAQFDTLTQMRKVNEALVALQRLSELTQASSLLGRTVTAVDQEGREITGTVSHVKVVDGVPMLDVGGKTVDIYRVKEVR
ncbi:MAG TPA: flagellar hook capping FlgD N-terminal domain-containing protein [Dehalococcoidia bacterium]